MSLPYNTSASFYVPRPATPISKESFAIPPSAFQARFQISHHALSILTDKKLFEMAFDAGYGAPTDQAKLLRYVATVRKQLHAYHKARWKLLDTLLETNAVNGEVRARPMVRYIESTEKGDAAFILGCLGSRYATEEWLNYRKETLNRFWHFSVYANSAVSISLNDSKSRPDYIAHATSSAGSPEGQWYAVEAKGTLGQEDWRPLQVGLGQARLLKRFGYSDRHGDIKDANVDDHAVSLACFENQRLHIVHVDPPAVEDRADADNNASFVFNSDMVELLSFYQAYHQFKSLTRQKKGNTPSRVFTADAYLGELILNGRRGADVLIAIPQFLYEKASLVSNILVALSFVTPAIGSFYRDAQVMQDGQISIDYWNAWLGTRQQQDKQDEAIGPGASLIRRRIWQSLRIEYGSDAGNNLQVPSTPLGALNRIANAAIVGGKAARQGNFATIAELRARLNDGNLGFRAASIWLRLQPNGRSSSFLTLHGLLILSKSPDSVDELSKSAPSDS